MAFLQDNTPQQDVVEFAEYLKEDFAARERRLKFKEEELNERQRKIEQREAELWRG